MAMSRLGKMPIPIPKGVEIQALDGKVVVRGQKGALEVVVPAFLNIAKEDSTVKVQPNRELKSKFERAMWGTVRAHLNNAVKGVSEGWKRELEINGIGYAFKISGKNLLVSCGYSHEVILSIPEGVYCKVEKNVLAIEGISRELVGNFAGKVRSVKRADPYLAKGIKYVGEVIRRKAGKSVKK